MASPQTAHHPLSVTFKLQFDPDRGQVTLQAHLDPDPHGGRLTTGGWRNHVELRSVDLDALFDLFDLDDGGIYPDGAEAIRLLKEQFIESIEAIRDASLEQADSARERLEKWS